MKSPEERRPTVKQVYALSRELCERSGEEFPRTLAEASELIDRLRAENGKSTSNSTSRDFRSPS